MPNAYQTKQYSNLFAALGHSGEEIQNRVADDFNTVFFGSEDMRLYHETEDGMGYMVDTGNDDVRTEGQSYGMMLAVQMDRKDIFDRIWKWTHTYMYIGGGDLEGYFSWSARTDGVLNFTGCAPDGEEYFAMALLFASNRWGDGEGIFHYKQEARELLRRMVHNPKFPLFHPRNRYILFVPGVEFTDPSYHLPHFYELFAEFGNPEDREFFHAAAKGSREYLKKACHPVTGLSAETADFDGVPYNGGHHNHNHFYSDAYRVAANIALDYEWFAADPWACVQADNIQRFFCETAKGKENSIYTIDGTPVTDPKLLVLQKDGIHTGVLHPVGLLATNAQASLAAAGGYRLEMVKKLWDTPLRTGARRYYDNLLYLFAMLALSGNYRIY